jgi:hemoglobin
LRTSCAPPAAAKFIERAQLIAQSLEMGIASVHGVLLDNGRRFALPSSPADP